MRAANRVLMFVLSVALVGGGLLVAIEAVSTWTNSGFLWIAGDQWLRTFETTPWSEPSVIAGGVAAGTIGVLLVILEIRPHRARHAKYRTDAGEWLLLRRSTEGHLQRHLEAAVPVSPIRVRLATRGGRWRLRVKARAAATSRPELERAARAELARLRAPDSAKVTVATSGGRR